MSFLLITPMAAATLPYLNALAESVEREVRALAEQRDIMGWRWRIQVDSEDYGFADVVKSETPALADLPATISVTGRKMGSGMARTVAWVDAGDRFSSIVTIDADDVFLPGGLAALLAPLAYGDIMWVAGGNTRFDGLSGDTISTFAPGQGLTGRVMPGKVREAWRREQVFPFAAATAAYRATALWEVGGWPGTPTGQDAALLLAVSDRHPGWAVPEPVFGYRTHSGQATLTPEHQRLRLITNTLMARRLP